MGQLYESTVQLGKSVVSDAGIFFPGGWYRGPMKSALTTVLLMLAACAGVAGETSLRCADCPEVQVNRVIDGDTLDTSQGRVRLFGIDAPERGQRCASEATVVLRELAGDSIRLEDGPRLTDRYGRTLAYAFTVAGTNIDAALIREGLATAWTRDGQHCDFLVKLEREVRRRYAGCLW